MDLLIWGGPVYGPGASPYPAGDVGNVQWERPTEVLTFSAEGSSANAALAESYRDADGRILPNMLASRGRSIGDYEQIAIAGFSAFHGAANLLLAADADSIDAAVLLDACFETPGSPAKAGFVHFATLAANGDRLMVFSASGGQNGPGLPPTTKGYECALHAANEGAAAAGVELEPSGVPDGVTEPNCGAFQAQGLHVLSYCEGWLHGDLINKLGVQVLQGYLVPYLGDAPAGATPGHPHGGFGGLGWGWYVVGAVAVVAAGYGAAQLSRRA